MPPSLELAKRANLVLGNKGVKRGICRNFPGANVSAFSNNRDGGYNYSKVVMADVGLSSKGLLGTIGALIAAIVGITTIQKNCEHDPNESAFIHATNAKVERGVGLLPLLVVNFENLGKNDAVNVTFESPTITPEILRNTIDQQSPLLRQSDIKTIKWVVWQNPKRAQHGFSTVYLFEGTVSWKDRITGTHGQNQWCFEAPFFDRHYFDEGKVLDLESCVSKR